MKAEGPYFDELTAGQVFPAVPGVTLTEGLAAVHQSITGDRLALSLDTALAEEVTGASAGAGAGGPEARRPANPALVWDVAIGQSTVATQHVKANLFYRGLWFRRFPVIGDTLRTTTRVDGLRQNRPREGRAPTGLAALRITTVDQYERPVLDFWRCAMLPLRDPSGQPGHVDDLDAVGASAKPASPPRCWTAGGWTASPHTASGRSTATSFPATSSRWPGATWSPAPPNWPGSRSTSRPCTTTSRRPAAPGSFTAATRSASRSVRPPAPCPAW